MTACVFAFKVAFTGESPGVTSKFTLTFLSALFLVFWGVKGLSSPISTLELS